MEFLLLLAVVVALAVLAAVDTVGVIEPRFHRVRDILWLGHRFKVLGPIVVCDPVYVIDRHVRGERAVDVLIYDAVRENRNLFMSGLGAELDLNVPAILGSRQGLAIHANNAPRLDVYAPSARFNKSGG